MPYPTPTNTFELYRDGGTTLEIAAMVRMVLVVRGFRARLDERLRAINQSAARMETLSAIINMQGPVSQSDVARRLRVEGATVTRMVDLLSKEGLVERSPHPSDRRVNLLRVTEKGEGELRRIFRVYDTARSELLSEFAQEEIAQVHLLTGKMLAQLDMMSSIGPDHGEAQIGDLPQRDRLRD